MDENVAFEARAVLAPRRARQSRLALLLPLVALVAVAAAGMSGTRESHATAEPSDPVAIAVRSQPVVESTPAGVTRVPQPDRPATAIGLDVHRLDEVQLRGLGRDDVVAVVGWYVATAITDCPPLAAVYRNDSLPDIRGNSDGRAFCKRTGVLYASPPDVQDSWSGSGGLGVVGATIVVGVVVPPELEMIGADATEVVVVGRFVETSDGCGVAGGCAPELVVDHVAWALGA
jgi:hypothetical protein